jgi:hypothetical protein
MIAAAARPLAMSGTIFLMVDPLVARCSKGG